jgi:PKD repeat protein
MVSILQEDNEAARLEKSYRVGVEIPVDISSANTGQWDNLPGGGRLWRVSIKCDGAKGIGLNYNELRLPKGADIFVYTPDQKYIIGAISSAETPLTHKFATRPLYGEEIVIEYYEPQNNQEQTAIEISGIVYMYRSFEPLYSNQEKSVSSGSCEVNVNCEEGQNWQKQKQGVVKIYAKVGSGYFWCTGTVLNNTAQDFNGFLLTASHCSKNFSGGISSDEDLSQWIFYFNFESPGCITSGSPTYTLVGALKIATSENPSDIGSDFLLLRFLTGIPPKYNPFYCGWDAGNGNSISGVCIHHPDGDVKKISTYTSPLGSGTWGSTPNTHWIVKWSATNNGYGVTEGGSSGAPLFDDEGLVIGTLTGGPSSCQNTIGEDMFGKVPYSWVSNGADSSQQLKPWLDPGNTGILKMNGTYNDKLAVADFSANSYVIPVGGEIDFHDLSSGKPDTWHWYFQGGKPSESTQQNPEGIRFERFGAMNVKLVVSNEYNSDSIVKEEYIDVRAVISPNPTNTGEVTILSDISNENNLIIDVFDYLGKIAQHFEYTTATSSSHTLKLPDYGTVFIIRVIQGDQMQTHKVLVVDSY